MRRVLYRAKGQRAVCGVWLVLMSCLSCSVPPHLVIEQTETGWVDLRDLPEGYPSLGPHSHPYTLPSKNFLPILQSLYYHKRFLVSFMWGKPQRVFTHEEATYLSDSLSKAFDQVLPSEVVAFKVRNSHAPHRHTQGFCFIKGNALHLVIERLKQTNYDNQETAPRPNPYRWELYPRDSQRFYTKRPDQKGPVKHWMIIPISQSPTMKIS